MDTRVGEGWWREKGYENRWEGLGSENLRERVKGRACNSPLSRRASVEEGVNALRGWFLNRGRRGTAQWEKGLGGQCSEVKRGPQHFHDFPRLIVMHGAHPARLAFKLSATSSLFLLGTFLPPSPSSFSHWRPFPLFLSLSSSSNPFPTVFQLRH